ncbi:MAG: Tight adherence protein [Pseudonocardiales bacterium]|nr:Tight adherence protein [Pseudonocardiales bacterium]
MGALLGLTLGIGVLFIWQSRTRPVTTSTPRPGWLIKREEALRQAGIDGVGAVQLSLTQLLCFVIVTLLVVAITSTVTVSVCFGAFGFFLPVAIVSRLRGRRQTALRELWPEAVDNLGSAVRAGLSLPEALSALAQRGPAPLRPAFARFAHSYRASGRFSACLDGLKADLADPVGDRVCETLRVAREVGGSDLGSVLRTLSELLRSDARVRAELETRQGWTVNAARLAVAAPWIVLLMLGTQSSTLKAYNSPGGALLLVVGAAVCLIAYRLMLRIGRLPQEQRVLR